MQQKTHDINLKLSDIKQLFNSFDPSPFFERDLDDNAVEYIVDSVREFPKKKMRVVIHLPELIAESIDPGDIKAAISNYFSYKEQYFIRKIMNQRQEGRNALITGIAFLIICLSLSEFINAFIAGFLSRILSEGLMIAGWVGMWKPISIFLYDWWPLENEKKVYGKIKSMDVKIRPIKLK